MRKRRVLHFSLLHLLVKDRAHFAPRCELYIYKNSKSQSSNPLTLFAVISFYHCIRSETHKTYMCEMLKIMYDKWGRVLSLAQYADQTAGTRATWLLMSVMTYVVCSGVT